jgi:hypothetical protein
MSGFDDSDARPSSDINLDRPRRAGYCNPPADHQFPPGHSGNPRGRRKLVGDIALSLRAGLKEKIRITKGTVQKNVSKEEVALRTLIQKALKGDWKAFLALMKKAVKLGVLKPIQVPNYKGGVVRIPGEFWLTKSEAELWEEAYKEAARRNALWAQGLPYDR